MIEGEAQQVLHAQLAFDSQRQQVRHVFAGRHAHLAAKQATAALVGVHAQQALVALGRSRPALALETGLPDQRVGLIEFGEALADDGDIGVGKDDRQWRAPPEAAQLARRGVDSGDVALVRRFVQQGGATIGVAGEKDRQVGNLQGVRVDRRHAARVEFDAERLEADSVDVRAPADGGDDLVDKHAHGAATYFDTIGRVRQFGTGAGVKSELVLQQGAQFLVDRLVADARQMPVGTEAGDVDA